jgi:hypothetical protein
MLLSTDLSISNIQLTQIVPIWVSKSKDFLNEIGRLYLNNLPLRSDGHYTGCSTFYAGHLCKINYLNHDSNNKKGQKKEEEISWLKMLRMVQPSHSFSLRVFLVASSK